MLCLGISGKDFRSMKLFYNKRCEWTLGKLFATIDQSDLKAEVSRTLVEVEKVNKRWFNQDSLLFNCDKLKGTAHYWELLKINVSITSDGQNEIRTTKNLSQHVFYLTQLMVDRGNFSSSLWHILRIVYVHTNLLFTYTVSYCVRTDASKLIVYVHHNYIVGSR